MRPQWGVTSAHEQPRDRAAAPARPTPRARKDSPAAALRLQRLQAAAGNRAVTGLLAGRTVQRDLGSCPAPPVAPAGVTPDTDPKFGSLKRDIAAKASTAKAHPPAGTEVKQAQDAALAPADDREAQAKAAQADKMAAAEPGGFDKAGFIAAVNAAVARQAPQNLDEADKFATSGKADQIKGEVLGKVTSGKTASAKDITDRTREAPDTAAAVDKPVTPLPPSPAAPAIAPPDASQAVPDKAPAGQTDLRAGQCETDHRMADAGVTEDQLARSNEPEFTGALAAKKDGEQHTAEAPAAVRDSEAKQLAATTASAQAAGQAAVTGMTGAHATAGNKSSTAKSATKAKDEQDRARIAGEIKAVFDETRTKVETVLNGLDDQVGKRFDDGERDAKAAFTADHQARMTKYKDDRYSGLSGKARWLSDQFTGLPAEANGIYLAAKQVYETRMQAVISGIADFVGEQLGLAKQHIADGRARVREKVAAQPPALRKIAGEAATEFGSQFDDLEKSVDDKQDSLVEDLAQKYTAARGAIDDEIKDLQAANKGLWDKAKEAIGGAIETILKLKDMLLGVLARAAGAVSLIIAKPIEFLGNLVNAVKTGVVNFASNIVEHLKQGLKGWLLGNLAAAGIEIPDTFDVKGILRMVLSVLGLTWASVRARILKFIPEPVLSKLEKTVEVVGILVTEGLPGLWKWVVEKLGDLKEMVLGEIKEFVIEKIVKSGITWIISLLNPAAAFIKACKAIYDIVMFFVEKAAQIKEFVDSVLDSVESIARGGVGAVAGLIENTLAKALPMVLGFLASLLGLGGISEKIRSVLEKVQAPVGKVVDTVVGTVVKAGKKLLGKFGRKNKDENESPEDKQKRLDAGLAAAAAAVERLSGARLVGPRLIRPVLAVIRLKYRMTELSTVAEGGNWVIKGAVNPQGTKTTKVPAPDRAAVLAAVGSARAEMAKAQAAWVAAGSTETIVFASGGGPLRQQGGGSMSEAKKSVDAAFRYEGAERSRDEVIGAALKMAWLNDPSLTPDDLTRMQYDPKFLRSLKEKFEERGLFGIPRGHAFDSPRHKVVFDDSRVPEAQKAMRAARRVGSEAAVHAEVLVYQLDRNPSAIGVYGLPQCDSCRTLFKGFAQAKGATGYIVVAGMDEVRIFLSDGQIRTPEQFEAEFPAA